MEVWLARVLDEFVEIVGRTEDFVSRGSLHDTLMHSSLSLY